MRTATTPSAETYTVVRDRHQRLDDAISAGAHSDDARTAEAAVLAAFRDYRTASMADEAAYSAWLARRLGR